MGIITGIFDETGVFDEQRGHGDRFAVFGESRNLSIGGSLGKAFHAQTDEIKPFVNANLARAEQSPPRQGPPVAVSVAGASWLRVSQEDRPAHGTTGLLSSLGRFNRWANSNGWANSMAGAIQLLGRFGGLGGCRRPILDHRDLVALFVVPYLIHEGVDQQQASAASLFQVLWVGRV